MEESTKSQAEEKVDLSRKNPQPHKRGRGRPSDSKKHKSVSSPQRGRPRKDDSSSAAKLSDQNQGQAMKENTETTPEILPATSPKRGRPPKVNKDSVSIKTPETVRKRGRPPKMTKDSSPVKVPGSKPKQSPTNKVIKRRGRPRKIPLTPEEEEERRKMKKKPKGPRVWKPLGRPRIYPRVEPPIPPTPVEPKGRGRPQKSESKKGAHLRKSGPKRTTDLSSSDGVPKKRGRSPGTAKAKTNGKELPSSATPGGEIEQDIASPPSIKRSRFSSGKVESRQDPPPCPPHKKRERKKAERGANSAEAGESLTVVSQHRGSTRSQPRIASAEKAVSEKKDEGGKQEGGPTMINEHSSGQCQMLKKPSQGDTVEKRATKRGSSGRKTAVPRKVSQAKGSRAVKSEQEDTAGETGTGKHK